MKTNLTTTKQKLLARLAEIQRKERALAQKEAEKKRRAQAKADEALGVQIRAAAQAGNPAAIELIKLLEARPADSAQAAGE